MSEFRFEHIDRFVRCGQQLRHGFVALAPRFDRIQPMPQRADQSGAALVVRQQIILQIRVARDHPDIA